MWKIWKQEIIGISVAAVVLIAVIVGFTLKHQEALKHQGDHLSHLMVGDTVYWYSREYPGRELPEGFAEIARVETELTRGSVEKSGEAWYVAAGTPVYGNEKEPGWVYLPGEHGRWNRFVVEELRRAFLRYDGELYLPEIDVLAEGEREPVEYRTEDFSATGETTRYPGDWNVIPKEHCETNSDNYGGVEILLNPEQPDLLLLTKQVPYQIGRKIDVYSIWLAADSVGLDLSAYE